MAYRFEQNRNPYTIQIAELMRQQNDPRANAALASGQIWGNTLQGVGQQIGQLPGKVQALQLAESEEGLRRAQTQRFQNEDADRTAGIEANKYLSERLKGAQIVDKDTGLKMWDRGEVQNILTESGMADRYKDYAPIMDAADQALKAKHVASQEYLTKIAQLAVQTDYNRPFIEQQLQMAVENGAILPSDVKPLMDAMQSNPERLKQIIDGKAGITPPDDYTLNPEQTRFEGGTNTPVATGAPKPVEPPKPGTFEAYVIGKFGPNPTADQTLSARQEWERANDAPAAPPSRIWVMRDGKAVRIAEAEYRPGDLPASTREQGRPVTSGDAGRIADFDTSLSDLAVLKTTLTDTAGATGTVAALGAAIPAWATDLTGWGTDAKKRQGVIDRVKQVIGKVLEGGVLRKEDEIKYEKILPTIKDTAAVAESKLAGLEQAIVQRRRTFIENLDSADFDVANFPEKTPAAQAAPTGPDLSGLAEGKGRKFTTGPFAGQTWTVKGGRSVRVN